MNMGFVGSLERLNSYGKRQCRSLFWRVRAALKRASKNAGKQQLKFQYDPSSYALNFDDGCSNLGLGENGVKRAEFEVCSESKDVTWVCLLLVESK